MAGRLIFVESNTTGSGMLALATADRLRLDPVLLTSAPQRYVGLTDAGVDVIECDTNSFDALADTASRFRAGIAGVTTTSEFYLATVARLAGHLGLPGNPPDAILRCRDKSRTRRALADAGVGQPGFMVVGDDRQLPAALREVGLPCVVKPVDESGSQDVLLCRSYAEAAAHVRRVLGTRVNARNQPSAGVALIEEYLDAPEYSVEMFSTAGSAACVGITAKSVGGEPYFVETGHHFPAALAPDAAGRLVWLARDALTAVGVREGPTHVEVKLTAGRAAVVEINARLAGGMIPELVRLVDGIDLIEQQVRAAVGLPVDLAPVPGGDRCAGIRFVTADRAGTVLDVSGVDEAMRLPGVRRVFVSTSPGAVVAPARDAYGRIGHVIACGRDAAAVRMALDEAVGLIRVSLDTELVTSRS
jgi:cysteine synthase A